MWKFLVLLLTMMAILPIQAQTQKGFTLVYATSDDGFVNIREKPTNKSKALGKIYMPNHGLSSAMLIEKCGKWWKVISEGENEISGYAYSPYLGIQNWYSGKGKKILIAKTDVNCYLEDYSGESEVGTQLWVIHAGTIIADENFEDGETYWILNTAHDNLYIPKSQVEVKIK